MALNDRQNFINWMNVFNTITQFLLGAVAISAIKFANGLTLTSSLKQHIYLCVIGYIILMAQAILSISSFGWSSSFKFKEQKNIHWVMQIVGASLAIAGSGVRIADVSSHFNSAHGICGILALAFTCCNLLGGIVNLLVNSSNTKLSKFFHSVIGCTAITCAFLALIFAFDSSLFRNSGGIGDVNANMLISFTAIALAYTLLPSVFNLVNRIQNC